MAVSEVVFWTFLILLFAAVIAGTFIATGQPIVGSAVAVPQNCRVDGVAVSLCAEECGKTQQCAVIRIDCRVEQIGCDCAPCA